MLAIFLHVVKLLELNVPILVLFIATKLNLNVFKQRCMSLRNVILVDPDCVTQEDLPSVRSTEPLESPSM